MQCHKGLQYEGRTNSDVTCTSTRYSQKGSNTSMKSRMKITSECSGYTVDVQHTFGSSYTVYLPVTYLERAVLVHRMTSLNSHLLPDMWKVQQSSSTSNAELKKKFDFVLLVGKTSSDCRQQCVRACVRPSRLLSLGLVPSGRKNSESSVHLAAHQCWRLSGL